MKTKMTNIDNPRPNLAVNVGGIRMSNPVMTASGTFGYGEEYADILDLSDLGAIVVKGISPTPATGNRPPRTVETVAGLINAIGLQNPGAESFIANCMPFLRQQNTAVIVNIWGRSIAEYGEVAARFDDVEGVDGLEVNVSCPNIKEGGHVFGTRLDSFRRVLDTVRKNTSLPLMPKLAPNVPDIAAFACAAEDGGADAISLINSLPAMAIDIETRTPILTNITGGLSGPAIHPVALKLVWEAAQAVSIPIVGMGGIMTAADALEFIIAGATAVAIGTATFADPLTALKVVEGISDYLQEHSIHDIAELSGSLTGC